MLFTITPDVSVSDDDTPRTLRSWWIWLALAVLAAICLQVWLGRDHGPTYRRVAECPLYHGAAQPVEMLAGLGIMPCAAGYCVRVDARVFSLRDWTTGAEIWRVTTAVPVAE